MKKSSRIVLGISLFGVLFGTLAGAAFLYWRHRYGNPLSDEKYVIARAKAAEEARDFYTAADWFARAAALNPFKGEYVQGERFALVTARDFDRVIGLGEPELAADPESFAWYAYAHARTGERSYVKRLRPPKAPVAPRKSVRHDGEDAAEGEAAEESVTADIVPEKAETLPDDEALRFVCAATDLDRKSVEEATALLTPFTTSPNPRIRLESRLALGELDESAGDGDAADRLYAEAAEICPSAALPFQIARAMRTGKRNAAIDLRARLLELHPTAARFIEQAECLALERRADDIAQLAARYAHGNLDALVISCYTDALRAWCAGDAEGMVSALASTRARIRTPFALMMAVEADVIALGSAAANALDTTVLETDWCTLAALPPFADSHERAYLAIRSFVGARLAAGMPARAFGPLAETLLTHGVRDRGFSKIALSYLIARPPTTADRTLELLRDWPDDADMRRLANLAARTLSETDHPHEASRIRRSLGEEKL